MDAAISIVFRNQGVIENLGKSSFVRVAQMGSRLYLLEVRSIFRTEYMPSAFLILSFYFFISSEDMVID